MRIESSGKPDAWKLARPVWGWGRGETPRPTPRDFPSIEPPDYLQQLNPQLYEEECRRVQSRFDEAVRLAEEAFCAELAKLVGHLTERLSGQEDGKPKIFRDSAIENLTQFFQRFRALNVRSSEQLDRLVTVTAALAAFLSDPQAFSNGARDLTAIAAENVARPVAEVPGPSPPKSRGVPTGP